MSAPIFASHGAASALFTLYLAEPSELLVLLQVGSLAPTSGNRRDLSFASGDGNSPAFSAFANAASSNSGPPSAFSVAAWGSSCGVADAQQASSAERSTV